MSISQKTAWIQLLIFGALVVSWVIMFSVDGTVLYWQYEDLKMNFYWSCAAAFGALVIMNITGAVVQSRRKAIVDERDRTIFRRASLWATSVSYSVVVALLLALSIYYMNDGSETLSVFFPLFIVIVGGVVLLLTQAITALLFYGRKVNHDQS